MTVTSTDDSNADRQQIDSLGDRIRMDLEKRFDVLKEQLTSRLDEREGGVAERVDRDWRALRTKVVKSQQEFERVSREATAASNQLDSLQATHERQFQDFIERLKRDFKQDEREVKDRHRVFMAFMEEKTKEVSQAVTAAKLAAGETALDRQMTDFAKVASFHDQASKQWLASAGFFAIVGLGTAVAFLLNLPEGNAVTPSVISGVILRVAILSLLAYGAMWSAKNYRVNQHLQVTNTAKVTALATYRGFLGQASRDDKKDEILMQATGFLFTPAQTGYLGKDEEVPLGSGADVVKTVLSLKN